MTNPLEEAKTGAELIGAIIKTAGDNPDTKKAAANLGKTALTITQTINNALLPLAAVNFAFDKARKYFESKFHEDIALKTSSIPLDQIIEPKASIAGPALQGLAFTHDEPDLKEMYLSLLATSMDNRSADEAHPAFVEIIKQLNSAEARLLKSILSSADSYPIIQIRLIKNLDKSWVILDNHVMNSFDAAGKPKAIPRQAQMVDNWVRLGLVEVTYVNYLVGENSYKWADENPTHLEWKSKSENADFKVVTQKGMLGRSALGLQFGKAAGLF